MTSSVAKHEVYPFLLARFREWLSAALKRFSLYHFLEYAKFSSRELSLYLLALYSALHSLHWQVNPSLLSFLRWKQETSFNFLHFEHFLVFMLFSPVPFEERAIDFGVLNAPLRTMIFAGFGPMPYQTV